MSCNNIKIGDPVYEIRQTGHDPLTGRIRDSRVMTMRQITDNDLDRKELYVRQKPFVASDKIRFGRTVFTTPEDAEEFILKMQKLYR